jgi:cystathionine gamma-synthase
MAETHENLKAESWLVAAGRPSGPGQPLNVPPVPASNFLHGSLGGHDRAYSRDDGTPTWEALEAIVGGLELGRAVSFASGMAAVAAIFDLLETGARVVLPDDCYQGVGALAAACQEKKRLSFHRLALQDTTAWIQACQTADLLWLETPSNPLLKLADIQAIGAAARQTGVILAVDNTFATPLNQRPLEWGATFSIQSATKFIGGHSDLLAGVVSTREDRHWQALRRCRELNGATPGTLEAFLAVRGARTLALRLQKAQQSATLLAERLKLHTKVACVRYPGLPDHPGHELAKKLLTGFGTLLSFDLRGGAAEADAVCRKVGLIRHATSLGSVESTMERRAAVHGQEHLPASLLRLSVGIEDVEDLWADLAQAFHALP